MAKAVAEASASGVAVEAAPDASIGLLAEGSGWGVSGSGIAGILTRCWGEGGVPLAQATSLLRGGEEERMTMSKVAIAAWHGFRK
jgi:hypothetical protein